jgi:intergrase/recombinase
MTNACLSETVKTSPGNKRDFFCPKDKEVKKTMKSMKNKNKRLNN